MPHTTGPARPTQHRAADRHAGAPWRAGGGASGAIRAVCDSVSCTVAGVCGAAMYISKFTTKVHANYTHHGAIRAKRRRAAARRVPAPPAPHPHLQLHLLLRVRLRRMGRRRRRFGGGGGGGGPRLGRRRRRGRERASRRQRLLRPPVPPPPRRPVPAVTPSRRSPRPPPPARLWPAARSATAYYARLHTATHYTTSENDDWKAPRKQNQRDLAPPAARRTRTDPIYQTPPTVV